VSPPATDTGLKFVTKGNVAPYTATPTRYEGSTKSEVYVKHTGAISV
jgi:simple sugar transport system substrate-binding protein